MWISLKKNCFLVVLGRFYVFFVSVVGCKNSSINANLLYANIQSQQYISSQDLGMSGPEPA
jgi:hypothetical protein